MINTKPKELIHEAYERHQSGRLHGAEQLYKEILEEQPEHVDALFFLGILNLQQGIYDTACTYFMKTIKLMPDHAAAHCNLGTTLQESGKPDEAIISYRKSISLKPDYADAHYNLGNTLKEQGRPEEAVICYKKTIELSPGNADSYCNLGNTFKEHGKLDEAVEYYRKASELDPYNPVFHCNLGAALQESGALAEAISSYMEAVKLDPNYAMAFSNMGSALHESGKPDEAITCYERAIALNPDYAEAHNNLGTSLLEKGKSEESIICHKRAIELNPDCAETHNNLGTALMAQRKLDSAITSYKKALLLNPKYAEAHNNLGTALMAQSKFDAAIISHKKAIELKPDYAEAYNNLGTVLKGTGRPEEAIAHYRQAIELKTDYAQAHLNLAFALLLTENFKKGFQEYEWRLRLKRCIPETDRRPVWDGSYLNGKSILVYTEQGIGDSIQFVRYLPMVKEQGGYVIVECQQSLCRLLKNFVGIDEIMEKTSHGKSPMQFDVQVPLLSLPGIFDTTVDSIPRNLSYIKPDPVLVSQWRAKFDNDNNLKVGIVWAGNPKHIDDRNRSCSLNDFAHLTSIRGLTFYSLQKGLASAEANKHTMVIKIVNPDNELNDFADTAAAIENLDLVIAVDTAVAHLAGAIGKPVWTLLPFVPDWRWMLERSDSPWYPGMRLFRQTQLNDWAGVFNQVKEALIQEIDNLYLNRSISNNTAIS
ncbi:MAG: tetratricopeptide repeat protein [Candidatus Scalindua rubra]|nr:tetratricopeptide repeat protein [Candidatus Scalindua rubra]TWU31635.1 TPR repeat-containing protein YrrB [Candidatus Brocadiaceae bacterium S225]